jgi:hypothetical protein
VHNALLAMSIGLWVMLSTATQDSPSQSCPHSERWQPEPDELRLILREHALWVTAWQDARQRLDEFVRLHPRGRAVLCNADLPGIRLPGAALQGADLRGVNLYAADLEGVRLEQADLSDAYLAGVNLSGAQLQGAHLDRALLGPTSEPTLRNGVPMPNAARLQGANLSAASLSEAVLVWAELDRALLMGTRLEKADLRWARLRGARLDGADLSNAWLAYADLTGATYSPLPSPPDPDVAGITGIATLDTSFGEPLALVRLRELLRKAELRDLEREATFAIERSRTRDQIEVARLRTATGVAEGLFRWVAYDLTTAYGLHPSRALVVMLVAGALLIPVYSLALWRARAGTTRTGAIHRVWPANRIEADEKGPRLEAAQRVEPLKPGPLGVVAWATYFSLLSACHIGFREFNAGKWIASMQRREYELRGTGWVRTVSGLQSLLSLYLLAIWVLTYFGRPFG